jgi:predicted acetyltransferase
VDIRIDPVTLQDYERWIRSTEVAFGSRVTDAQLERWRPLFDPERALAAFDGDRIVGTAGSDSMTLTVPGATVEMAGVVAVGVQPTHRRRGILRAMMLRQLAECRDRGHAIAGLWASESAIYGRFGYGMSAPTAEVEIERAHARFRGEDDEPPGRVELVDRERALQVLPEVYERIRPAWPGFSSFSPARWRALLEDLEEFGGEGTTFFIAVHDTDGTADGIAMYRLKREWTEGMARGTNTVRSLLATNPGAETALWRFCVGIDLMSNVVAWPVPIDVPVWHRLADPRRLKIRVQDGLWLRLLDVPSALAARRYSASGRLVIGVRDDVLDWVGGAYELDVRPDGAACRRASEEPDLVLEARDLSATYLGAVRFSTLARAGLVRGDADAIGLADAMFRWEPVAFCPFVF